MDRWDYTKDEPEPPNYSIYTGLTLQQALFAFCGLSILQMIAIFVVKIFLARNFKNGNYKTNKIIHVLECLNYNHCFKDWDNTDEGKCSLKQYEENYRWADKPPYP